MNNITYRTADVKWDIRSGLGNHRFIAACPASQYVRISLPWRRCDLNPEMIGIRICCGERQDGIGQCEIRDIIIESCSRDEGTIVFRAPAAGEYEIYYMPFIMPGEWYAPDISYYLPSDMSPSPEWAAGLDDAEAMPGEVVCYESRTEFDSFYPMEFPMTKAERRAFTGSDTPFTSVAVSRLTPVRMKHEIPFTWLGRDDRLTLSDAAYSNEHYFFQISVCAVQPLSDVKVRFTDSFGTELPLEDCICISLDGVDTDGQAMKITRDADADEVLTLWCGIKCENFKGDRLTVNADVTAANVSYSERITVELDILPETLPRNGDDDLWRMSRLFWLNDTIGISNDVIAPYTPIDVDEEHGTVGILGRSFKVGELGLPAEISSCYDDSCQITDGTEPIALLCAPMKLNVTENGAAVPPENATSHWLHDGTMQSRLITEADCGGLSINSSVTYEADGHVDCMMEIKADRDGVYSFTLRMPLNDNAAPYMMGMCREGGRVPSHYEYRWNESLDGNEVWFGGARAGIQIKLMQETEHWHGADPMPRLWGNNGKGLMRVRHDANGSILNFEALTGNVTLTAGQTEVLHFHMIVTPFHPIDYTRHWTHHYYHKNTWNSTETVPSLENAKAHDTHTVILHQGSPLNENINYPFILAPKLKNEIDRAHSMRLAYKIYYTVRELSNYTAELWALLSLGDEIFNMDGDFRIADYFTKDDKVEKRPDGGPWLVEHLTEGFVPAWHQFLQNGEFDCAIRTQPKSRWHNYYLKGLDWLIRVVGIDGIYLDGIGYDRHITRRVRRVMEAAKPGICDIDIHCGNEHNPIYGGSVSACIYMEHFAYADSLWNGEGFDCQNSSPENFFTEMCGIPFGLMGEMLQSGGNPWRGMLYGMTARCGWSQGGVSTTIWRRIWDKFGIADAKMLGYWHPDCPVAVDNDEVKATVYVKANGDALVCIASWFPYTRSFRISVDREALGITGDFEFYAPQIEGMRPTDRTLPLEGVDMSSPVGNLQEETVFSGDEPIPIVPGGGWMFFIRRK